MTRVTETVVLRERDATERFVRASGPGNHNVNKDATGSAARPLRANAVESPMSRVANTSLPHRFVTASPSYGGIRVNLWPELVRPQPGDVVLQPLVDQGSAYALSSSAGVFQFRCATYAEAFTRAKQYARENAVDVLHTEDGRTYALLDRHRRL